MKLNEEEEYLLARFGDLAERAYRGGTYTFSGFLSLAEQSMLLSVERELPAAVSLYGGSDCSERKIAVFGSEEDYGYPPEPPVAVIGISPASEKYGEELSHRDYLGAILALGIDRGTTGDIIIRGKHAWLFCLAGIADFIVQNLSEVRHTTVRCRIESGEVPDLKPVLREESVNVASERTDAVIAAVTNISRGKAAGLFGEQKVFVNGRLAENAGRTLKDGDMVTVRGYGRFIYRGIGRETRKGRLYVVIERYV